MKYLVGYIISGKVIVEAESEKAAKDVLDRRLPALLKGENVIVTASELPEMLEEE